MTDELTQRLVQSRHYCTDRLVEVKEDVARFQAEGLALKEKLEAASDDVEAGQIRRRRRFLSRRIDELKAERAALAAELEMATVRLSTIEGESSSKSPSSSDSTSSSTGATSRASRRGRKPVPSMHA